MNTADRVQALAARHNIDLTALMKDAAPIARDLIAQGMEPETAALAALDRVFAVRMAYLEELIENRTERAQQTRTQILDDVWTLSRG